MGKVFKNQGGLAQGVSQIWVGLAHPSPCLESPLAIALPRCGVWDKVAVVESRKTIPIRETECHAVLPPGGQPGHIAESGTAL